MDLLIDLVVTLSRWSREHLHNISLAIMASLLVLLAPALNAWVRRSIGHLNFFLRSLFFVLFCLCIYGLAIIYLTPWLASGLGHLNNYNLFPLLLLILFVLGVLADR